MRTLRLSLAGTVILALLGGLGGAVVAHESEMTPMPDDGTVFPTGMFVSVENGDLSMEFNEDGTGHWHSYVEDWEVRAIYATRGDLYTEMTFEYPMSDMDGSQTPATYYWDWDGEHLTFELWGEDLRPHRNTVVAGNTWRLVADPRTVVVAVRDIPAGDWFYQGRVTLRIVPATEAGPDAFTKIADAEGRFAAVPIAKGQPITPDLLEPAE